MYVIAQDHVVEAQVVGSLHGQTTRTTFHYRVNTPADIPDGREALDDWIIAFEAAVAAPLRFVQSAEFEHIHTTMQVIHPNRYRYVLAPVNMLGETSGQAMPSTCCVVVRRFAETSGRMFQGRIYLPGVPASIEDNSRIASAAVPLYDDVLVALKDTILGTPAEQELIPIVRYLPPVSGLNDVTGTALNRNLRSQRRREVGVGE
jgi:hypothetical protein